MQKHLQLLSLGRGMIGKQKLKTGLRFLCFMYFHIPFLCNKSVMLTQLKLSVLISWKRISGSRQMHFKNVDSLFAIQQSFRRVCELGALPYKFPHSYTAKTEKTLKNVRKWASWKYSLLSRPQLGFWKQADFSRHDWEKPVSYYSTTCRKV